MNTIKKDFIKFVELPTGHDLTIPEYTIIGQEPGPTVHIQAAVHGAEHQGNVVIFHLLDYLSKHAFRGEIRLIPHANPWGGNLKFGDYTYGRFDPIKGMNWNRTYYDVAGDWKLELETFAKTHVKKPWPEIKLAFKQFLKNYFESVWDTHKKTNNLTAPKRLGLILQEKAFDADLVLDLHTGPVGCRYIYTPQFAQESASLFNIPHLIVIPHEFGQAMDEGTFMPWITLQAKLKELGVADAPLDFEAFTIELGGQERISFAEGEQDTQGILYYLYKKGVLIDQIKKPNPVPQFKCDLKNFTTLTSPYGGLIDYIAPFGKEIKKDEIMAKFLCFSQIKNEHTLKQGVIDLRAPEDLIIINHAASSAVNQGMEIFQVIRKYQQV